MSRHSKKRNSNISSEKKPKKIKNNTKKKKTQNIYSDDEVDSNNSNSEYFNDQSSNNEESETNDDSTNNDANDSNNDNNTSNKNGENMDVKKKNKETQKLKKRIHRWLDCDDKIKELNKTAKKLKDVKKEDEDVIIKMIEVLGIGDQKMDIDDNNNKIRSRVYRQKSITKGALKEDIIKNALMEVLQNEKTVIQLVKKIETKRPINERYYLKRTKGNGD